MINDLGFWGLNNIINETERFLLAAIGAEHSPNGSMLAFKTYWRFNSSLNELNVLLNRNNKESFLKVINKAQSFWSDWKKPKLIGIDYLLMGKKNFKVYLPQKGFSKPLSIVDLCLFLLKCGWKVNLDIFSKLSYFILGNQSKVEPSAYSICISEGKEPYIKLEIATKAYFKNTNETLNAVTNLAESIFLDSYSIYSGFFNLKKHKPFPMQLLINVISIYFFPDGSNRITIYCGL